MNKVLEKRDSLESFIREQTLGPGINGYRYIDLEDENIDGKDFNLEKPINYTTEILDIVPAAIYSTGILFPDEIKQDGHSSNDKEIINSENNNDFADEESDYQNYSLQEEESTEVIKLNQQFPKIMGLTCCFDNRILKDNKIEFDISFRHYSRIEKIEGEKYGLLCEVDVNEIKKFIEENNLSCFTVKSINGNHFILISKFSQEKITEIKDKIKGIENSIAESLLKRAKENITTIDGRRYYLSNLKSTIYYELKNNIIEKDKRKTIYHLSQEIELIENITKHLKNILSLNSSSYGLWQSKPVKKTIILENLNFNNSERKKSYLYNKTNVGDKIEVKHEDESTSAGLKDIFKCDLSDEKKKLRIYFS